MSQFLELCQKRQSCRSFADKPVEHDKLVNCIEAARLAPSACNSQPWSFVVVETPELVTEVAACGQSAGINSFLEGAKSFIFVLEEHAKLMPGIACMLDSQYFAEVDTGAAALSVCLAAEDQGLGTCYIGLFDRPKLCALLDIPEHKHFAAMIAVGYPKKDTVRPKKRKALADITRFL